MSYRNANYTAFYVDERYFNNNLKAYSAEDFCYFQTLKAWKSKDSSFPFINAHNKTYDVRDGSNWERTLKPRLHERLRASKNIILILSNKTKESRALCEEISYGIDILELPIIVIYPNLEYVGQGSQLLSSAILKWNNLPAFKSRVYDVPTAHIPFKKEYLRKALADPRFSVTTKSSNCTLAI